MSSKKLFYITFFVVFLANIFNTNIAQWDSKWTIHTAYSMIYERNIDLDEYSNLIQKEGDYGIWKGTEHVYNYFPIGISIVAVPFVFVAEYVFELALVINPDLKTKLLEKGFTLINVTNYYYIVEYFIASFIAALCAALIFLIARRYININQALVITFVFAFCTSLWSVAGRALWMHGPLMLCLLITIYLLTKEEINVKNIITLGIILAFSFIIRPTGLIFFAGILLYLFLTNKKFAITYLLSGLSVFAFFFVLNYSVYGTIFSPYYQYYVNIVSEAGHPNFLQALAGNMFSPGKGLLIFSPILIFSAIGIYIKIKAKEFTKLDFSLLLIFVSYYVAISLVTKWWDTSSFGPRYISDVLPILIYFIIPYFQHTEFFRQKKALSFAFIILLLISFFIHTKGALSSSIVTSNEANSNEDNKPEKMWEWKKAPFLR